MPREKWVTVWPPPKEVSDPNLMLIEEKRCDDCFAHFGWVGVCRAGQYNRLDILASVMDHFVGWWNDTKEQFTVLGKFRDRESATLAYMHILRKV